MEFKNIIYEKKKEIVKITINRPKVLNALNEETAREICIALDNAKTDDGVKVVIITGAGDKAFIAGVDIQVLVNFTPSDALSFVRLIKEKVLDKIKNLEKPVIAAVNGYALGGGCEVAMACDLVLAVETAKFGQSEINLGLSPGLGGMTRLPRLIGMKKAKELVFTGSFIDAAEAEKLGLINAVISQSKLDDAVNEIASKILEKSSVAIRAAKEVMNCGMDMNQDTGLNYENLCFAYLFSTEDAKEGIRAFLEKRKPMYKGK